jgi:hypothetical protein
MWPGVRHLGHVVRRSLMDGAGSSNTWPQLGKTPALRMESSGSSVRSGVGEGGI